jgi:hypothetical protein
MANSYKPLIMSEHSPFRESLEKRITTSTDTDNGIILNEKVTLVRERQYLRGVSWVKLSQDKELLRGLSPWACQILIHIALNLEPNQEKMKIMRKEIGMDRRKFSDTIVELLLKRILVKTEKREWYWINVGLLIFGTLNKHE